jgi:uncharacterized membrane protein YbhN (UPF0104 family)
MAAADYATPMQGTGSSWIRLGVSAPRRRRTQEARVERWRTAGMVAVALLLTASAVALVGRAADYAKLADVVRKASGIWFPIGFGGILLAYLGYILAYRAVARFRGGPELGYWTATRVVVLSFGAFAAGSAPGGLAVQLWALRRTGMGLHDAVRRVLAFNTLSWAILGLLATASAALVLAGAGTAPYAVTVTWISVVPFCFLAGLWVSAPGRIERLARMPPPMPRPQGRRLGPWGRWLACKLRAAFADAVGGLAIVRAVFLRPLREAGTTFGFFLYWLGHLATLYASVRAFGGGLGLAALGLAFTTAYVITALPLPGGGAGGIEAALALTLHLVGLPLAQALLAAVLYRVLSFWVPLGPALALVSTLGSLQRDLTKARPQPA